MTKATDKATRHAHYTAVLTAAFDAARCAQAGKVENLRLLDCGFAWVVVHDNAFMRWARDNAARGITSSAIPSYGSKHHAAGWCFWCPGPFNGQSISIHEAGARAFRDIMAHGLQCNVELGSRLD